MTENRTFFWTRFELPFYFIFATYIVLLVGLDISTVVLLVHLNLLSNMVLDHFWPKNYHFRSLLGVQKWGTFDTGYEWRTGLPFPTLFAKIWDSFSNEKKLQKSGEAGYHWAK